MNEVLDFAAQFSELTLEIVVQKQLDIYLSTNHLLSSPVRHRPQENRDVELLVEK